MSASNSRLHLLIPGLFGPLHNLHDSGVKLNAPLLERLLSRADRKPYPGRDYQTTLFSLFDFPLSESGDLPEGAVNYYAEGGSVEDACWMRADPVHLRPDRDRLLLFNHEQLGVMPSEAAEIAGLFNDHFVDEGLRLLVARPEAWYLKLEHCPKLKTHGLNQVTGHHIEPFMPEGADARHWRQLLNEMQMLLFRSPVNLRREAQGNLTINGIWLSGVGRLPDMKSSRFARVYGDDMTAAGLASLAGISKESLSNQLSPWNQGEENLMVLTDLVSPVLNVDPYAWSDAVMKVERMIERITQSMGRVKGRELLIYPCNGEQFLLTPGMFLRFWRRVKPLSTWVRPSVATSH